jgi:hypothetical protein
MKLHPRYENRLAVKGENTDEGQSLGRLAVVAEGLQEFWQDKIAFPRQLYRLAFLEQISAIAAAWWGGLLSLSINLPIQRLCCSADMFTAQSIPRRHVCSLCHGNLVGRI